MSLIKWLLGKDKNGNVDYSIDFTDESYQWVMASGDTDTLTVPDRMKRALIQIQPGAVIYVGLAAVPASTSSPTKTGAQMSPSLRKVLPGDVLNFRAMNAGEVVVTFFEV